MHDIERDRREARLGEDRGSGNVAIALLVAATFFMENLDGTVIATALPHMAASFHVRPTDLGIGMSAYLLTLGVFIPVSGWIAERFGSRRTFAAAIVIFTLASALCGVAQGVATFVVMRVLQGIGGAMMVPVGRLIVLRETPRERLIAAMATLTWPALVAPVLGPPIGGFLAEHLSWRWIFYLNLPLGALAIAATMMLIPPGDRRAGHPLDAVGVLLSGGALIALVAGFDRIDHVPTGWGEVAALEALALLLGTFAVRHFRRAAHPLIDLDSLRIVSFAVSLGGGSLLRMAIGAVPFLLPLMLQIGFGYDAVHAGLLTMAVFAGNLTMKIWTLRVLRRFGFRRVLIVNGLANVAMLAACASFHADMGTLAVCAILFAGGLVRSLQFTTLNTMAFADVGPERLTDANALFSTAMQLSMGFGITLGELALAAGRAVAPQLTFGRAGDFRIAFLIVAFVALLGVWDCLRLAPDVGDTINQPKQPA